MKAAEHLDEGFRHIVWEDDVEAKGEPFWDGDEDVPERVKTAVREAIREGAVFDSVDGVRASEELKEFFEEKLTQPQGWSTTSLKNDLRDRFGVPEGRADDIARTEPASVLNNAREEVFEDLEEETGETIKYKWIGPGQPDDGRTTECCQELKELTDPKHGGTPRTMEELVELEKEVHDKHFPDLEFRKHCLHPNERHTFTEVVDVKLDHPAAAGDLEFEVQRWPGTFEAVVA